MLRGINRQDIFEDDEDYLQTELHSQVNERLWCGNTPALSIDRCLLWSYTEVMKKEKMITEPSPGHHLVTYFNTENFSKRGTRETGDTGDIGDVLILFL
jgi:hypothetical protein